MLPRRGEKAREDFSDSVEVVACNGFQTNEIKIHITPEDSSGAILVAGRELGSCFVIYGSDRRPLYFICCCQIARVCITAHHCRKVPGSMKRLWQ